MACLQGNDFIARVKGLGFGNMKKLMVRLFTDAISLPDLLSEIAANSKSTWLEGFSEDFPKDSRASDFPTRFWEAYNNYLYPPVYRLSVRGSEMLTIRDVLLDKNLWEEHLDIELGPLRGIESDKVQEEWSSGILLGYSPPLEHKLLLDTAKVRVTATASMHGIVDHTLIERAALLSILQGDFSRVNDPVTKVPLLRDDCALQPPENEHGEPLPYGSIISFAELSLYNVCDALLRKYLMCRGLQPPDNNDTSLQKRQKMESIVENLIRMDTAGPERVVSSRDRVGSSSVDISELLPIQLNPEGLKWTGDSGFVGLEAVLSQIRSEPMMSLGLTIDLFWESAVEHWQIGPAMVQRISRLLKGGNINYLTLRYAYANLCLTRVHVDTVPENCIVFSCDVMSSKKKRTNVVRFVFSVDKMKFYGPPISHCSCPNGCRMCSHQLALLMFFRLLQTQLLDCPPEEIKNYFPPVITLATSKVMPFPYLFGLKPQKY
jgi:hypothetical protein